MNEGLRNVSTNKKMGTNRRKRFSGGYIKQKVLDNLRDGLPYPYTEQDGKEFISAMLAAALKARDDADGVCRLHKR